MSRATQQNSTLTKRTLRYRLELESSVSPPPSPPPPVKKSNNQRRKLSLPKKVVASTSNTTVSEKQYKNSIPKAAFERVVRDIMKKVSNADFRITAAALNALQIVSEEQIVNFFEQLSILSSHAHRVTVKAQDVATLRRLQFR